MSSPGDVPEERRLAREAIERLGKDPAFRDHFKLDPICWDDPEARAPMLANRPPQESVNRALTRPSECDLVVTIFWARMGTPLEKPLKRGGTPFLSGTEWEYEDARRRRRDILLYRRTAKLQVDVDDAEFEAKRAQKRLVDQFFERLKGPSGGAAGGFTGYERPEEFGRKVEGDLRNWLAKLPSPLPDSSTTEETARGKSGGKMKTRRPSIPAPYLDWLKKETGSLELLGIGGSQGRSLFLSSVYVPLVTTAGDETAGRFTRIGAGGDMREKARLLLHALGRQSLYVPGGPGSGKSTFCSWVAWLACEGAMPPADVPPPDDFAETLPETLRGKLPVLVRLREFWEHLPAKRAGSSLSLAEFLAVLEPWLRARAPAAESIDLAAVAARGLGFFIFDGVDEVPTTLATPNGDASPRKLLLDALSKASREWTAKGNVLLVTSRPYGIAPAEAKRLALGTADIADLPSPLQALLAHRWFRIQKQDAVKGDAAAAALTADVRDREWLQPLAANPLMLTAMCAIYSDGGKLPQDRHQLYDRIVESVLVKRYDDPKRRARVRFELGAIAHAMHTGEALGVRHPEPLAQATFDEAELALRADAGAATQRESVLGPREAREDLVAQSGVLTGKGHQALGFYHLSIQEFLAAERIFELELDRLEEVFLGRAPVANWRNTLSFLFGRYLAAFTVATRPIALVESLIDQLTDDTFGLQLVIGDCAEMLAAKGYPVGEDGGSRLRRLLLSSMTQRAEPRERCEAGATLGKISDPRFDPEHWFLPVADEAPLGFLRVPAGPFTMGSDPARDEYAQDDEQPQHEVPLQEFFIARYPVTVAQFRAFVDASGHEPADRDCLHGVANHPVAFVTWHDALAYCRWLTGALRAWRGAPRDVQHWLDATLQRGWEVTLPSEAEWERAARGTDGRIYPWGDPFDAAKLNAGETGIGRTSAVGAFPAGVSPVGALDLSGNVWEWTRSLWGPDPTKPAFGYPYDPRAAARENLEAPDSVHRVVRGGSFRFNVIYTRAAFRSRNVPVNRYGALGFRVVVRRP